jgi:excisionase family DNA binding protein
MSLDEMIRELVAAEVEQAKTELRAEFAGSGNGWPEWMPLGMAAEYLGSTVAAVRKLYERRRVPHYQDGLGAKVWLRRSEVDAYIEGIRVG